jgi:hypothetical protein
MAARCDRLRMTIALEAARLMYEEGVKQYFTAKRIAARRTCGRVGGKRLRYRPNDLPSNGEIRDALLGLAELAEGSRRTRRLFAMRVTALEAMQKLERFDPRLIGSVSTGHVRRGSDIDLHVFADDPDPLVAHVRALGWTFDIERVSIIKGGKPRDFLHVHVADVFAIELTVYPRRDIRTRPRSSTDGKPIVRLSTSALEALLAREHADAWKHYLDDGDVEGMDEALTPEDDDEPMPGPYDGLLADGPGPDPLPWALLDAEARQADDLDAQDDYDALPGFEGV